MTNRKKLLLALSLIVLLLITGCSQSFYSQGRKFFEQDQYDRAVDSYYSEITANPQNASAWRELGITYYKMGNLAKAEDALEQANLIKPDARTHLFFGLIYEKQNDYDKALSAYAASLNLNPSKSTRDQITSHIDRLLYQKYSSEVNLAIENENAIEVDTIPENSIAVINFDGSKLDPDYAPIAVGLAEFTASDLAKVNSLNVVERMKLDVIMDELKLSETDYIDQGSAPRVGKLLGTGKVITGSLLGIGDDNFRLDGMIINTTDSSLKKSATTEGELQKIFDLQKEFVFAIIDDLGITLTLAERDAIQEVPTESFLAFLSFSKGLRYQKRGMHDAAQQEFNNAIAYDQNFGAAKRHLTQSMSQAASVGYEASAANLELSALSDINVDLSGLGLDGRLSNILNYTGVIPNTFSRTTAISQPTPDETGQVIIRVDFDNE